MEKTKIITLVVISVIVGVSLGFGFAVSAAKSGFTRVGGEGFNNVAKISDGEITCYVLFGSGISCLK